MATESAPEPIDRRQQILEAALKVFSTRGFHKATIKDIAEAAGKISPGLIYWYFKDKHDLLLSIIRERAALFQLIEHPGQLMDLPPPEGLAAIARAYLRTTRQPATLALFRILLSEAIQFPQVGELFYTLAASRLFDLIVRYLQHQVDLGRLRPHDTQIAARSFLGMFVVHVLAREVFHQPEAIATPDEHLIATAVDICLYGLAERTAP
jgi:TetR/AcrR family transcriptional regulator